MSTMIFNLPQDQEKLDERFRSHNKLFDREVLTGVLAIFDEVARSGDEGIRSATRKFDQVELDRLELTATYTEACINGLPPSLRSAIGLAIRHVHEVNTEMLPRSWEKEIRPGTVVGEIVRPLDSVGIWIPARKGPLLSTAIMLVVAAKAAGVPTIVVGMPPLKDGTGDPGTVAAAKLAGADRIIIGNGVAIIAAFAQGTESVPEVDGIFGPGPGGIAAAMSAALMYGKKAALGLGPTECAIIADGSADPERAAYDLINEAEHGPDSSAVLVTTSAALARQVEERLGICIGGMPEDRRRYLQQVFGPDGKGAIVVTPTIEEACDCINGFAPEHLMVVGEPQTEQRVIELVRHAGEVLIGGYTPFSAGNYAIGITAVLPTNGFAKAFSGVTCKDMVKVSTTGRLTPEALRELAPVIREMSGYEQLPGHRKAADIRLGTEPADHNGGG
ncbi:histidinol dehydrogenase [Paenibacillus sp. GCM10012303]|uniref:histidinol dehydrogenase n=1 Tax=Paenibacillus sp. GCM10012303 TaxID=3317340 RepID=UPI003610D13A